MLNPSLIRVRGSEHYAPKRLKKVYNYVKKICLSLGCRYDFDFRLPCTKNVTERRSQVYE